MVLCCRVASKQVGGYQGSLLGLGHYVIISILFYGDGGYCPQFQWPQTAELTFPCALIINNYVTSGVLRMRKEMGVTHKMSGVLLVLEPYSSGQR